MYRSYHTVFNTAFVGLDPDIVTPHNFSLAQRSSRQELEGEAERQKRTFQRQLSESRTRNTSVTQLRGDLRSSNTKLEELTKENQKLKEVNQVGGSPDA